MTKAKLLYQKLRSALPLYFIIICLAALLSLSVHLLSFLITPFADFINSYPAAALRAILALITSIIPFSIAETMIILLPAIFIFICILLFVFARRNDQKRLKSILIALISVLLSVYILFVFTLGTSYHTKGLDEKMGLERRPISTAELESTCYTLAEGINSVANEIEIEKDSSSSLPYSYRELCKKLDSAYDKVSAEYSFISSFPSYTKRIMLSEPMTYTHISGVYSFFTGEANVNVNYPDYILPFTVAHEMAHQRGIAREDEANFVAFLVCIASDDAYIKYSGYTQVFEYAASALYSADKNVYFDMLDTVSEKYIYEALAYNDFMDTYKDSTISNVSSSVNDAFQQMQGQSAGIKSYGLVVDLAAAYFRDSDK